MTHPYNIHMLRISTNLCERQCGRYASRVMFTLCNGCYMYERVHGNGTGPAPARKLGRKHLTVDGYVRIYAPNHVLALEQKTKSGYILEHRMVAYDKYGNKDLSCHWCTHTVVWDIGRRLLKGDGASACVIDHLNDIKYDNRSDNLVISCSDCNRKRGLVTLFVHKLHPDRLNHFLRITEENARTPRNAFTGRRKNGYYAKFPNRRQTRSRSASE